MIYKTTRHLIIMGNHVQYYRNILENMQNIDNVINMRRINRMNRLRDNNIHYFETTNRNNFISNFYNLN